MAGSSFLRARSPVTPKTTSAHGSGTRGRRRSRGSRSGLLSTVAGIACTESTGGSGATDGSLNLFAGRVELATHAVAELGVGVLELLHTLGLEHLDDVVVPDADGLEVGDDLTRCVIGSRDRVAADHAVISNGVERGLRHRVDR